jgi:hypothetical protein
MTNSGKYCLIAFFKGCKIASETCPWFYWPKISRTRYRENGSFCATQILSDGPRLTKDFGWSTRWDRHVRDFSRSTTSILCPLFILLIENISRSKITDESSQGVRPRSSHQRLVINGSFNQCWTQFFTVYKFYITVKYRLPRQKILRQNILDIVNFCYSALFYWL